MPGARPTSLPRSINRSVPVVAHESCTGRNQPERPNPICPRRFCPAEARRHLRVRQTCFRLWRERRRSRGCSQRPRSSRAPRQRQYHDKPSAAALAIFRPDAAAPCWRRSAVRWRARDRNSFRSRVPAGVRCRSAQKSFRGFSGGMPGPRSSTTIRAKPFSAEAETRIG